MNNIMNSNDTIHFWQRGIARVVQKVTPVLTNKKKIVIKYLLSSIEVMNVMIPNTSWILKNIM